MKAQKRGAPTGLYDGHYNEIRIGDTLRPASGGCLYTVDKYGRIRNEVNVTFSGKPEDLILQFPDDNHVGGFKNVPANEGNEPDGEEKINYDSIPEAPSKKREGKKKTRKLAKKVKETKKKEEGAVFTSLLSDEEMEAGRQLRQSGWDISGVSKSVTIKLEDEL